MSNISTESSQKIKNMSVICAMLVVAIHVFWPVDTICLTWFIHELVDVGIARIAVPFFFVVSGFFLAAHFDEENWWRRETKKRVRSLVVPYFAWSLLAILVMTPLNIVSDILAHSPFGTSLPFSNGRWLYALGAHPFLMPYYYPLWYVRWLFIFVLLSPLFKAGISKLRVVWILLAFVAMAVFDALPIDLVDRSFWPGLLRWARQTLSGIFYFSVGIYLRRFHIAVRSTPLAVVCAVYGIGCLVVRTVARMHGTELPVGVDCLMLPALMYATWHVMPTRPFPVWLTSCSFPIYLLHLIFLSYARFFFKHCPIERQLAALVSCFVAIAASIVLTHLLRKCFPRLADFLFGGRT